MKQRLLVMNGQRLVQSEQGGQWNTVFIEQPYLPNGIDKDYIRWLYTAITRAKDKLIVLN